MNIGIIGTGNMGKILIDAFIEANAVQPSRLTIVNRTLAKAYNIKEQYPGINVGKTIQEVVKKSDLIFLCVKPLDMHPLLQQHHSLFTQEKCLVSITSPVSVKQLESIVNCNVARMIPSITNRALAGISLCTFGDRCSQEWQKKLLALFSHISTPIHIEENITRVASDIVSCGPAFFSYLLQRFIDATVKETEITEREATELASGMLIGMGKLLEKEIFTLRTLQEKVCVKGGITGEGIKVLDTELGDVFEHLLQRTHEKYNEDLEKVSEQFRGC
ncbi:late competence protein ComER [Bacillus sp. 165]|uniref:late competence protein ComER n=1 Tax=Bacillus sp. 165 TaxID=1529117 RepID=UPI001AD9B6F9|nr:late competence protein ComER [Bacillus sp. 165]MBO9129574.1 late competence protein ComER [Bacillus sp. 165]